LTEKNDCGEISEHEDFWMEERNTGKQQYNFEMRLAIAGRILFVFD